MRVVYDTQLAFGTKQHASFGTSHRAMMPYGREANCGSGIALAVRHKLKWFIHQRAELPAYTPQS